MFVDDERGSWYFLIKCQAGLPGGSTDENPTQPNPTQPNRRSYVPTVSWLALTLLALACDDEPHDSDVAELSEQVLPTAVADLEQPFDPATSVPSDWTFIGYNEVCENCVPEYPLGALADEDELSSDEAADPPIDESGPSRKLIAFNVLSGKEYEIELSAALVAELAEAAKNQKSWNPDEDEADPFSLGLPGVGTPKSRGTPRMTTFHPVQRPHCRGGAIMTIRAQSERT